MYIYNNILFADENDNKLNKNDKLAYFLIDDDKTSNEYGIKIKKGYDKFISWQNSFLNSINESKENKNFKYYLSNIKLKTDIQKANKSQIILTDQSFAETSYIILMV